MTMSPCQPDPCSWWADQTCLNSSHLSRPQALVLSSGAKSSFNHVLANLSGSETGLFAHRRHLWTLVRCLLCRLDRCTFLTSWADHRWFQQWRKLPLHLSSLAPELATHPLRVLQYRSLDKPREAASASIAAAMVTTRRLARQKVVVPGGKGKRQGEKRQGELATGRGQQRKRIIRV